MIIRINCLIANCFVSRSLGGGWPTSVFGLPTSVFGLLQKSAKVTSAGKFQNGIRSF